MTSAISTYTESMYEAGGGKGGSLVDTGHGPSQGSTSESNKKGEPGASGHATASTSRTQKARASGAPAQKKPTAPLSVGAPAGPPGESSRGRDGSEDQVSSRGRDAGQGRSNKKGESGAPGEAVKAGAGETAGYTFEDLLQQVQAVQSSVLDLPAIVLKDPAIKSALASLQAFSSSLQDAEMQAVKRSDSVPIVKTVFCKQLQSKLTLLAKALEPYKQAAAAKLNVAYLVTQLEATASTSETQMARASGDPVINKDVDDAKTKEAVQKKLYTEWTTEWKKSNRANKILKDVDDAKTRGDAQQKLYKDDAKGREEPKKEKAQEVAAEQKQQLEDQQKLYKDAVKKREEQQKEEAQEVAEERKELLEEALKRIAAKEAKKEEEEESAKHLRELTASCHFCP